MEPSLHACQWRSSRHPVHGSPDVRWLIRDEIGPTILSPDRMRQGACVTLRRATWGACGKRRLRQEGSGPAVWAAGGQIPTGLGVGCLLGCPVGVGEQSWDLGH